MSIISQKISEYDVTFATKEWLLRHGWDVVAFNPPGSQGTFTIPNPAKDPKYKGQTGSEAPDIIAVKNKNTILIVESKPKYSAKDVDKLIKLYQNKPRMELLIELVRNICRANNVPFSTPVKVILAKAHGGAPNIRKDMETFVVELVEAWDPDNIDPSQDPFKVMKVTLKATSDSIKRIIES
jgi:hypothetical protein